MNKNKEYDVIVVGAGHAGCEAALATARQGFKTLLLTINFETIASLPCNPSIGGQGKAQLVREVDALGGEMGIIADETSIQRRRLNTRKGIAVQANRFQSDKDSYSHRMLSSLLSQENLFLLQAMVTDLVFNGLELAGIQIISGEKWYAPVVILTVGTFLRGKIHIGTKTFSAGRAGEPAADALGLALERLGLPVVRFKTGTPPRVDQASIEYEGLEEQGNDESTIPFSIWSKPSEFPTKSCFITYTNEKTHKIIKDNFHRSALMSGLITGTGARYCPSIEDKLDKFPDKNRHKVFLEPEGHYSREVYLQGLSTSLPEDVQEEYVHSVKGLEGARITRPGYAIEYDVVDPRDLHPTLMSRSINNLFLAGQINGTSGYEEAAAQGLVAGINACAALRKGNPLFLDAETSYTGLMIQEITSLGIEEPYRIFTSRSPFRLNLRMTNAEARLAEIAFERGTISQERIEALRIREEKMRSIQGELEATSYSKGKFFERFPQLAQLEVGSTVTLAQALKHPNVDLTAFSEILPEIFELDQVARLEVEARVKYSGYLAQQQKEFKLRDAMKALRLKESFYENIPVAVSHEARLKILAAKPETIGQLATIPGVRASDLALIIMHLKKQGQ